MPSDFNLRRELSKLSRRGKSRLGQIVPGAVGHGSMRGMYPELSEMARQDAIMERGATISRFQHLRPAVSGLGWAAHRGGEPGSAHRTTLAPFSAIPKGLTYSPSAALERYTLRRQRHLGAVGELRSRVEALHAAGVYTSPFQYVPHFPSIKEASSPATDILPITADQMARYQDELQARFGKKFKGHVEGSTAHFRSGKAKVSLPLFGPVYSKMVDPETGRTTISGYRGGVNMIRMGDMNKPFITPDQDIIDIVRTGRDFGDIRKRVEETQAFLRHRDAHPYQPRGAFGLPSSIDMLHTRQFRWGRKDIIPAAQLNLPDELRRFSGFRFGGEQLYGIKGDRETLIKDMGQMRALVPELLQYARSNVKAKSGMMLHWDPTSGHAPLSGTFTTFDAADLDPFGYLAKPVKLGQQFRSIGLNVASMGGYAAAVGRIGMTGMSGALTGGRMLRTFVEREASAQAATMNARHKLAAGSPDIVSGLNVRGALLFGRHADMLPSPEAAIMTDPVAQTLRMGTAHAWDDPRHAFIGSTTPIFRGTTGKGSIAGLAPRGASYMRGADIISAAHFKTPDALVRSMMYGYAHAGMERGLGWEQITGAMRRAIGEERFIPGSTEAVLRQGERLFRGSDPTGAARESIQMLRRFGQELGTAAGSRAITPEDFLIRERGEIVGMRALEHISVREQATHMARTRAAHGIGLETGQRIGAAYPSIFRGMGASHLSRLFARVRQTPELRTAVSFRPQIMGTLGQLISPEFGKTALSGDIPTIGLSKLQEEISANAGAFRELLDIHGGSGDYGGLAKALKDRGLLTRLFEGPGFILDLERASGIPVAGEMSIAGIHTDLKGTVSRMAIPNLEHTNIKDQMAARIIKMGRPGDLQKHVAALSTQLLEAYTGGKHSLIAQQASPRFGSELVGTAGRMTAIAPNRHAAVVNEYFDNLLKAGRITGAQRAGLDPNKMRFGFISGHRAAELSPEHRLKLKEQQYLRSIITRDPVTGRASAAHLIFAEEKFLPKELRGLVRGEGMVFGGSDIAHVLGDEDFDRIRAMIAEGIVGPEGKLDRMTARLQIGHRQLAEATEPTLRALDKTLMDKTIQTRQEMETLWKGYIGGLADPEGRVSPEVRALFAKTVGPQAQEDILMGSIGLKALTGQAHGPALERQITMEAMTRHRQAPFDKTMAQYYSQDFLVGMQQLYISKHSTTGKSLKMIADMNVSVQKAAMEGAKPGTSAYQTALSAIEDMIVDIHSIAGKEVELAFSAARSEELFGLKDYRHLTDATKLRAALKTGAGAKLAERVLSGEMAMFQAGGVRETGLSIVEMARRQYKDPYSAEAIEDMARTIHGVLPTNATPVQREIATMMGTHLEEAANTIRSTEAIEAKMTSDKLQHEVQKNIAGRSEPVGMKELKETGRNILGDVVDHIKSPQNRTAYGLAGVVLGGIAALGALTWAGRKLDQWTTPAGQQTGVPGTPRTEYYTPEESMLGSMLSGTMRLPPDSIPVMAQGVQRFDQRADMRIMDTRVGLSNRMLGYDAEDVMGSLYVRSQV